MADTEKKPAKKKIVSASTGEEVAAGSLKPQMTAAAPTGSATGLRVGAIILWVLAIGFEVLALLVAIGQIPALALTSTMQIVMMIVFLVLDLVVLIIGSQLWKKANHIRPASEKNKAAFWLWNNLGLIVAVFAFVPFIVLVLLNKDADKRTKTIATVAAVIALLIGGASSIDYNPISQEQQQAAIAAINQDVYWAPYGKVYHTDAECSAIRASTELKYGTVEQAIAAGRTRLCSFCAKRDDIDTTNLLTDGQNVSDADLEDSGESETDAGETEGSETE